MIKYRLGIFITTVLLAFSVGVSSSPKNSPDDRFLEYRIDPQKQQLKFFWKDDKNRPFKSLQNLKDWLALRDQHLVFAMNGGMYKTDNSPLGLYIEDAKIKSPVNSRSGNGNFYLKPNAVFYITKNNQAGISTTENFRQRSNITFATQSGPMLLINGKIHPAFTKGSSNVNIRNAVGILPGGQVLFVMSKTPVNFYEFAAYFKNAGCKNALYLDGFVSRTYLPSKSWVQTDGDFGVILAEVSSK
ncbi:MAG: phosphodiester glycosidase family protein [Ferruginibacter sp.]